MNHSDSAMATTDRPKNHNFLYYVAQDMIEKYGTQMKDITVVFPNKRASLFLNEQLARLAGKPLWSPKYVTISDLFRQHSPLMVADPILLVCKLYQVYTGIVGTGESLDKFYGWGQLMISDFDDIDKNMADADKVFANLKDIHEFDDISYLDDEQKRVLKRFFGNFADDHESELKRRFLELWCHFGDIYHDFNETLANDHLAYEGALYRQVAETEDIDFGDNLYLFVGFNMMQRVELALAERLKSQGKARFYWDFDRYYMDTPSDPPTIQHEAGVYIRKYMADFPNELDTDNREIYDNFNQEKDIAYVSAPTENIQARYVGTWLRNRKRYEDGKRTAVVLADERLLQAVIHSIPDEVEQVNITLGYPLQQSPFFTLVALLIQMQTTGHKTGTERYRLHQVNRVLHHPYARFISKKCAELDADLKARKRFYPSRDDLVMDGDEELALLFRDCESGQEKPIKQLGAWLLDVLRTIGANVAQTPEKQADPLFRESLFRMYTVLNRLQALVADGDLDCDLTTWQRLITQIVQTTTIPFHGEPAEGVQVMGVLETRNLDFEHVLVLSCNEGNLPKGVDDASFIPYAIRKAYGLTTIDNKVAIYSYYFHSLLQRATDITLTWNAATEEGRTGEMSRFMLQLMVESSQHIEHLALTSGQMPTTAPPQEAEKDERVMEKLLQMENISPSAINRYLRCPLNFYYRYILGIQEPEDEDDDEVDNRVFGNIFHRACQLFYLRFAQPDDVRTVERNGEDETVLVRPLNITREGIRGGNKPAVIGAIVDQAFREQLFKVDAKGWRPEYNGLQLINRGVIVDYVRQLLDADERLAPFSILGLETPAYGTIDINTERGVKTIGIGGYIDRIDVVEGRIRVIDYKTGRPPKQKVSSLDEIFEGRNIHEKHTDYFLQAILYGLIVGQDSELNASALPVSPALLFIQQSRSKDYDPTLFLGNKRVDNVSDLGVEFKERLCGKIEEIFRRDTPFFQTPDKQRCQTCPYATLCGI